MSLLDRFHNDMENRRNYKNLVDTDIFNNNQMNITDYIVFLFKIIEIYYGNDYNFSLCEILFVLFEDYLNENYEQENLQIFNVLYNVNMDIIVSRITYIIHDIYEERLNKLLYIFPFSHSHFSLNIKKSIHFLYNEKYTFGRKTEMYNEIYVSNDEKIRHSIEFIGAIQMVEEYMEQLYEPIQMRLESYLLMKNE